MSIDPTIFGGANPLIGPWLNQACGKQPARQPGQVLPAGQQPARDAASGDGRLYQSAEPRVAGGTENITSATGIPAERLRSILDRISSNYYDSPHVRDSIARKLRLEFAATPAR